MRLSYQIAFSLTGSAIASSLRGAATTTTTAVGFPVTVLKAIVENDVVVAGDYAGVVTKYDIAKRMATASWKRKTSRKIPVADLCLQGATSGVITSYKDGALVIWSDASLEPLSSVRAHLHSSIQLADLDEDHLFAVAGDDTAPDPKENKNAKGYIRIFDRHQSLTKPLRTMLAHGDGPGVIGILTLPSPDATQKHLVSYGGEDATASIKLYTHADGFHSQTLYKGSQGRVMDAVAIDASFVVSAWSTGHIRVHAVADKRIVEEFNVDSVIIRVLYTARRIVALTEKGTLAVFPFVGKSDSPVVLGESELVAR